MWCREGEQALSDASRIPAVEPARRIVALRNRETCRGMDTLLDFCSPGFWATRFCARTTTGLLVRSLRRIIDDAHLSLLPLS